MNVKDGEICLWTIVFFEESNHLESDIGLLLVKLVFLIEDSIRHIFRTLIRMFRSPKSYKNASI